MCSVMRPSRVGFVDRLILFTILSGFFIGNSILKPVGVRLANNFEGVEPSIESYVRNLIANSSAGREVENLGRGLIAIYLGGGKVYLTWRLLYRDPVNVGFNVYRTAGDGRPEKLNSAPITNVTDFIDGTVDITKQNTYYVCPVINGSELSPSMPFTLPANPRVRDYISIHLRNDSLNFNGQVQGAKLAGVGDLDGDGEYEFVVKRGDQDLAPSQVSIPDHLPQETYKLEAYKLDGTFLWRVDLGPNIRPGIKYSPFIIFDLDCDGRAEVACKIGENASVLTSSGELIKLGDINGDNITLYCDHLGRQYTGPEYFAIIDGKTGAVLALDSWIEMGEWSDWGDDYGNRAHKHLMAVAYLDGKRPSLIVARGIHATAQDGSTPLRRIYVEAWNWRNGSLEKIWRYESNHTASERAEGYHNLRVGDIDGDGRDEIIYGSIAIDDDGRELWITGEGHGDRIHMSDIDPSRPGKEIWYVQENAPNYGMHLRDAATGHLIWGISETKDKDVGRGLAADIDPRYYGMECWASEGKIYSCRGETVADMPQVDGAGKKPAVSCNFAIWWDADILRELLDATSVYKYDYQRNIVSKMRDFWGEPGERNAPMGYGDILGDWREEVWYISKGETIELRIYITTVKAEFRLPTLMHDPDYRISVACETMGYMQATQPSFYLGAPPPDQSKGASGSSEPSSPYMLNLVIAAVLIAIGVTASTIACRLILKRRVADK
ncbi:MAG: rhamnogalacturonan lyase [Nitrososphaerota archaeon]|nr:rhamnogalacturonan lyase [Candidatus Bathyarchaeota archaeon]MDW8048264.1 rhamnogalacturonan lyase [Nitrososphaerota archaeon]